MWIDINKDGSTSVTVLQCSVLLRSSQGPGTPDAAWHTRRGRRLYFLHAVYLSATFSQLITFQIAFR